MGPTQLCEGAQGMKVSLNQVMELPAKQELETDLWIQPHGENWWFKKNCFTGKERFSEVY